MFEKPDYYTCCVAGLEIYVFGMDENPGAPVIFVSHGRTGAVEHVFGTCRELRDDGFIVIGLSQRNHGRRVVDPLANGGWSLNHSADMFGIIYGTAIDISTLIDLLPARIGVSMNRVGITGGSLGGHTTQMAMAHDTRIHVGASLIGSGDYLRLMELRAQANQTVPEDFHKFFPPELRDAVARLDPINNAAKFADRPLLMTNGAEDDLVQPECNERFFAAARPHYTDAEKLKLSIYPGLKHEVNAEMWNEARAWLRRWLLD